MAVKRVHAIKQKISNSHISLSSTNIYCSDICSSESSCAENFSQLILCNGQT